MTTSPENSPTTMCHALHCHPASPCAAVRTIAASASLTDDGTLALGYCLRGNLEGICIPQPVPPAAADELWQNTCLEAFVSTADRREYREFNFSPSGCWANYRFTGYRERDFSFASPVAPRLTFRHLPDGFQLDALLPPKLLPQGAILNIGLSAVIEASDGSKSYWALAHCAAQADFHFRQSFTLTLQRPAP
jgi:hypothetical protein